MAKKITKGLAVRKRQGGHFNYAPRNLLIYRYMLRGFLLRRPEDGKESILHWSRTVAQNYSISSFL